MTDILILERARLALQQQHDWHATQTEPVDISEGVSIVPADEYCDSGMYERTVAALHELEQEILRRTQS